MFKLDNDFLQSLGLGGLPVDEKNKLLQMIYERLEMNVGMRLAEKMTDQQLDEFESFIDKNDEAGALKWLETNFPNYKDVVAEELDKLKNEVTQVAPQILAAQNGAGQEPAIMNDPMMPGVPQPQVMPAQVPQKPAYQPQQPGFGQPQSPAFGQPQVAPASAQTPFYDQSPRPQGQAAPAPQQPTFASQPAPVQQAGQPQSAYDSAALQQGFGQPAQQQTAPQPAFDQPQTDFSQPGPAQPFVPQPPVFDQLQPYNPAQQAAPGFAPQQPTPGFQPGQPAPAQTFTPPPPNFNPGQ